MTSFSVPRKKILCTVIEAGPCVVTQIKTVEKDGYDSLQLGFVDKKDKHTTKPEKGHFKKARVTPRSWPGSKDLGCLQGGVEITVDLLRTLFCGLIGTSKEKVFKCCKRHRFGGVGESSWSAQQVACSLLVHPILQKY